MILTSIIKDDILTKVKLREVSFMSKIGSIKKNKDLNPSLVLVFGFAAVIFMGAILLNLPIASQNSQSVGFVNALFTSTSAVCVTGLIVVNTATHWTIFGQVVIMALIQIGGLGFMTMATLLALLMGKRIGLKNRIIMQEELGQFTISGVVRLTIRIVQATFIIEGIGAILLSIKFIPDYGLGKGIYFGIFHSVSAFCNAGFDIIGNSLENYVGSPIVNFTVMGLIILGGIGFTVIIDVLKTKKYKNYSLHTKLVLVITGGLILSGFVFFFLLEYNNITMNALSLPDKMLAAMFQSVTPRTAGFNTISTGALKESSKFLTIIYMFIGGSPGSTAGGIKTATFGVILFAIYMEIIGKDDVEFSRRRISNETVSRSLAILVIALTIVSLVTIILSLVEPEFKFINILFETVSAFGTVGLSTGLTGDLSMAGKIIISLTMFLGRVGPITVATAIAERHVSHKALIRYAEGKIFVG